MKNISKRMSYLLRHDPEDLEINEYGQVFVIDLLNKLKISNDDLVKIVNENNKQRFSISGDGFLIKANQGHSIPIKLDLKPSKPPSPLYHGTSFYKFFNFIKEEGIKKMERHHVHLTDNVATAIEVGKRYAKDINKVSLIKIDTEQMYNDGIEFFVTENNVWLTEYIDPKYFIKKDFRN